MIISSSRRCRHLSASEISDRLRDGVPHVTRLRLVDDVISYDDAIYGPTIDKGIAQREGDPILIKSGELRAFDREL